MEEKYLQEIKVDEKSEIQKEKELIETIAETSMELRRANNNFNFARGELIDYYVYQIKANQSKLNYLIKLAKRKGIFVKIS